MYQPGAALSVKTSLRICEKNRESGKQLAWGTPPRGGQRVSGRLAVEVLHRGALPRIVLIRAALCAMGRAVNFLTGGDRGLAQPCARRSVANYSELKRIRAASVRGRTFDPLDDQHLDRLGGRGEPQVQLLLNRGEDLLRECPGGAGYRLERRRREGQATRRGTSTRYDAGVPPAVSCRGSSWRAPGSRADPS